MSNIKQTIYKMMMTSTGTHMMDSGFGERGRAWQRNQLDYPTMAHIEKSPEVDFEQPEQYYTLKKDGKFIRRATTENELLAEAQRIQPNSWDHAQKYEGYTIEKDTLDSSDIDFTVSTYHHLVTSLEVDELCDVFNSLPCLGWDSEVYGVSKKQVKWLEKQGLKIGDGWNSYNGDSNLSQTLQGHNVYLEGEADEFPTYILLQIHQGADVRGGYTDAKLFKVATDSGWFDTNPTVYGSIDGVSVDTSYDGNTLRDENHEVVPVTPNSKVELSLAY